MRLLVSVAVLVALAQDRAARSEDLPEGSIGLRVEVKDGKIVVVEAIKGGPAEIAGLKAGDAIVKANNYQVRDVAERFDLERVVQEILKNSPGKQVKLVVRRDGKDMTIEVTVGKRTEVFPKGKD